MFDDDDLNVSLVSPSSLSRLRRGRGSTQPYIPTSYLHQHDDENLSECTKDFYDATHHSIHKKISTNGLYAVNFIGIRPTSPLQARDLNQQSQTCYQYGNEENTTFNQVTCSLDLCKSLDSPCSPLPCHGASNTIDDLPVATDDTVSPKCRTEESKDDDRRSRIRFDIPKNTHDHYGWSPCPGSTFQLRIGPNYSRNKCKAPSRSSLFDVVGLSCFKSLGRCQPSTLMDIIPIPDNLRLPKRLIDEKIPDLLVLHFQVPCQHPSFFTKSEDGLNAEIAVFTVPSPRFIRESRSYLRSLENSKRKGKCSQSDDDVTNATKLLTNWCQYGVENEKIRSRFKCLAMIHNTDGFTVPSFLQTYNGKPALINETGVMQRGVTSQGIKYLFMSVNVHMWSLLARKILIALLPKLKKMKISLGFTIEGETDEELPECILSSITVHGIDPERFPTLPPELQMPR